MIRASESLLGLRASAILEALKVASLGKSAHTMLDLQISRPVS